MNENWLNDIHDKLAHYEADEAPRGLWQDICQARAAQQVAQRKKAKHRIVWLWIRRASAVAAVLAVVLTFVHLLNKSEQSTVLKPLAARVNAVNKQHEQTHSGVVAQLQLNQDASVAALTHCRLKPHATMLLPIDTIGQNALAEKQNSKVGQETPSQQKQTTQQKLQQASEGHVTKHENNIAYAPHRFAHHTPRFTLSAYTMGALTDASTIHSKGDNYLSSTGPDYADWQDDPVLGMLLYNQGKDITTQIKHHLPVKVGFSLAYSLNKRVSLEAGLMYTRLTSDVREGTESHYFTGQQTLHYVGIPLGVKCKVLMANRFEVYASSGVEVAKCVSGQTSKDYVLNNEMKKTETTATTERPLQWSVKAAAGVQYNVLPQLGFYAEPGVSYYFKDGSSLRTIYKDKPFNFDLHVGVRVNLGH